MESKRVPTGKKLLRSSLIDCSSVLRTFVETKENRGHSIKVLYVSTTRFVVTFYNCPLLFVSELKREIDISTIQSEHVKFYHSVRDLLPLKIIIKEVIDNLGIDSEKLKFVSNCTVYDNNNGAIVAITIPRMTPISNHISIMYHWFKNHGGNN